MWKERGPWRAEGKTLQSGTEPVVEKERNEAQTGGGRDQTQLQRGQVHTTVVPRVGPLGGKSSTVRPWELSPGPVLAAGGALGGNRFPWL